MAKRGASLIQAAAAAEAAAPALSFFSEVEEAEKRLAQSGEFTGERLHRDRPGVYAAVVRMAAEGQSISATARALGVSRNTVCAVREREGISVEQEKKELLKDLRRASRLGVEKVIELLPETKAAKDAAIVSAVMIDKLQLLSGEATARVERVEVRPDQVKAFVDSLPVIEAEVIEEFSTGVAAGTAGQRAAADVVPVAALSDAKSDDLADNNRDDEASWATDGTTSDETSDESGVGVDGGGGGADSLSHALGVMNTEKQNFGQRGHDDLCKRTAKKKPGASTQARTTKKKKGDSGC
jgi:transposase-like protein